MIYIQGKCHVILAVNILFVGIIIACPQFSLAKFHLPVWPGYVFFFPEERIKLCSFVSLLCFWQRKRFCARADKYLSEFFEVVTLNDFPEKVQGKIIQDFIPIHVTTFTNKNARSLVYTSDIVVSCRTHSFCENCKCKLFLSTSLTYE